MWSHKDKFKMNIRQDNLVRFKKKLIFMMPELIREEV